MAQSFRQILAERGGGVKWPECVFYCVVAISIAYVLSTASCNVVLR